MNWQECEKSAILEHSAEGISLKDLKDRLKAKIPEILRHFNLPDRGKLWVGTCPIHNGDNQTAFNLNTNTYSEYCGRWFCNTQECHKKYGGDILGFIRGMIDSKEGISSFTDCLQFCQSITGIEKISFYDDGLTDFFSKKESSLFEVPRESFISRLEIPSEYYINRGFSKEVLEEFDVGFCNHGDMENRVVFPVYDECWKTVIGSVGRTIIDTKPKWLNQKGFKSSDYLFNYWRAFEYACRYDKAILVEGQGDVMRLWEAGHYNVFGLFGSNLSVSQESFLQRMGVSNIITIADNDQAGEKLRKNVEKQLFRLFNVRHVIPTQKDIGEMSIREIKELKL